MLLLTLLRVRLWLIEVIEPSRILWVVVRLNRFTLLAVILFLVVGLSIVGHAMAGLIDLLWWIILSRVAVVWRSLGGCLSHPLIRIVAWLVVLIVAKDRNGACCCATARRAAVPAPKCHSWAAITPDTTLAV